MKHRGNELHLAIRYCDESELTTEEKARMDAARARLSRQVKELIGKIVTQSTSRAHQ